MTDLPVTAERSDVEYWLAINRTRGLGPVLLGQLLERYANPVDLFSASASDLADIGVPVAVAKALSEPDWYGVAADLDWLADPGQQLLTWADPRYPLLLKELPDPPAVLFVAGDSRLLSAPQIAIVGSRNPTPAGEAAANDWANEFARAGLVVTSGMALGIDAAAHRGALAAGQATIAVAGTGLDRVYPARHHQLAHDIRAAGALVSEYVPGTGPSRGNFPRRNRLISGLSLGTLVIEAGVRSGSLITARLAAEQGRDVFAVPGSIHNPVAKGCHRLIRDGAILVESAADVVAELGPMLRAVCASPVSVEPGRKTRHDAASGLEPGYQSLLKSMGFGPVSVDFLVQHGGLTADVVSSMLLILELQGYVETLAGGRYQRRGTGEPS